MAQLQRNLNKAVASYNEELQDMKTGLLNYSVGEETYRFMESVRNNGPALSGSIAPTPSSLDQTTYEINRFDMIALLDLNGSPIYGGSYDLALGSVTP